MPRKTGNYNPQIKKHCKSVSKLEEETYSSLSKFRRITFILLFFVWLIPRIYHLVLYEGHLDYSITQYPPFSLMSQPNEDFHLSGEQII